jgi:glycosyltransferase involved in cell wall biosynthesis
LDIWHIVYALHIALDLRKQGCDVVHIYNYPQFAYLIKRFNPKLRVVLNMHGEWLTQLPFANLHAKLRTLDLIVSCSDFVSRSIVTKFPDLASRCATVPMGVSPGLLSPDFNRSADGASKKRLLFMGRLSPEKGVHVLLAAFELIVRRYPDATLAIVGPEWVAAMEDYAGLCLDQSILETLEPYYKGSYQQILKDSLTPEAAKRVTFVGLVPHNEVSACYSNADIYVSAAYYESFGMSIIEAMAVGLPVVVSRGSAVDDFVSDGHNGLLVAMANPSAIADAVGKLFENPRLGSSMASNAREMVRQQFTWDTISSSLMQMYQDVLNDSPIQRTASLEDIPA